MPGLTILATAAAVGDMVVSSSSLRDGTPVKHNTVKPGDTSSATVQCFQYMSTILRIEKPPLVGVLVQDQYQGLEEISQCWNGLNLFQFF